MNALDTITEDFRNETHDGFVVRDLEAVFRAIVGANWRAPINARVREKNLDEACAAIDLFVGERPTIYGRGIGPVGTIHITSPGYDALNKKDG